MPHDSDAAVTSLLQPRFPALTGLAVGCSSDIDSSKPFRGALVALPIQLASCHFHDVLPVLLAQALVGGSRCLYVTSRLEDGRDGPALTENAERLSSGLSPLPSALNGSTSHFQAAFLGTRHSYTFQAIHLF